MNITNDTTNPRPGTVAFVNCFDGTTFGKTVDMTAHEERRLHRLFAATGAARPVSPVRLPGRAGCYIVFAFPAPL